MGMSVPEALELARLVKSFVVGSQAIDPEFGRECATELAQIGQLADFILDPAGPALLPTSGIRLGRTWVVRSVWGQGEGETLLEALEAAKSSIAQTWAETIRAAGGVERLPPAALATREVCLNHLHDAAIYFAKLAVEAGKVSAVRIGCRQRVIDIMERWDKDPDGGIGGENEVRILVGWALNAIRLFRDSSMLVPVPDDDPMISGRAVNDEPTSRHGS